MRPNSCWLRRVQMRDEMARLEWARGREDEWILETIGTIEWRRGGATGGWMRESAGVVRAVAEGHRKEVVVMSPLDPVHGLGT